MVKLTVIYVGELTDLDYKDTNVKLTVNEQVTYLGHLPGGNVKIRHANGNEYIAHPACFKELL